MGYYKQWYEVFVDYGDEIQIVAICDNLIEAKAKRKQFLGVCDIDISHSQVHIDKWGAKPGLHEQIERII